MDKLDDLLLTHDEIKHCYYGDNPCEVPAWFLRVADKIAAEQLVKVTRILNDFTKKIVDNMV